MSHADSGAFRCTYILPMRRIHALHREVDDLAEYFRKLARKVYKSIPDLTVVG